MHGRAPAEALRTHLPRGLELDLFEDDAWIGVTPFRVTGLRARGLPPLPFVSSFLEVNARTYVTAGGKPGIWFFSLDASSELAVAAARRAYRLPYFRASMRADWGIFCATMTHEIGHLLGHAHEETHGSVMVPVFSDYSSVPAVCRAARPSRRR